MSNIITGFVAGVAATAPMTLAMELMHHRLPQHEQHSLPPRKVTMKFADLIGLKQRLREPARQDLTLLSHFGYGGATGALYAPLAHRIPLPGVAKGAVYGLAVWAGRYVGWLPAAGIMPPATKETAGRNAVMIAAHLIWGAALGFLTDRLSQEKQAGPLAASPEFDATDTPDQRGRHPVAHEA